MRTPRLAAAALASCAVLALHSPRALASGDVKVDIPFTKTVLPNGLTVILHEDHALPNIAVNTIVKV